MNEMCVGVFKIGRKAICVFCAGEIQVCYDNILLKANLCVLILAEVSVCIMAWKLSLITACYSA